MNAPEANLASRVAGEAAERQHLCDSCGHAPFLSSKTLHAHRTIHQTRGDVTLLNGLTAVITRPDEFSDWICPEDDCDYVSPHLLRLRSHLKNQSSKRRRQEEVAIAERAARDDVSSLNFSNGDASGQRSSSSAPSDNVTRRVRRRLDVDAAPPAPRSASHYQSSPIATGTRRRNQTNEAAHALLSLHDVEELADDVSLHNFDDSASPSSSRTPRLSSASDSASSSSTPPPTAAEAILAAADIYHDEANDWIVCMLCRSILSPRTAAHHARQKHGCTVEGLLSYRGGFGGRAPNLLGTLIMRRVFRSVPKFDGG